MEKTIAIFVMINFLIIGTSHITQRQAWQDFFRMLHNKGNAGAFLNGFLSLGMGSIIVSFHNVWVGMPTILTVLGWMYLFKSAVIFLYPSWNVRSMSSVQNASPLKFILAGSGMIVIAVFLGFCVYGGYPTP